MSSSGMNYVPKISDIRERRRNQGANLQVTTIVCLHLFWSEGIVVNFTLYITISLPLVGKHLEEGSTPRFRTAQDDCGTHQDFIRFEAMRIRLTKHLARSDDTIKPRQNVACFWS